MRYEIRYSSTISEKLEPFFSSGKLWEMDARAAMKCSASETAAIHAYIGPRDIEALSIPRFLQILFSALPHSTNFGGIIGFSKLFLREIARREDVLSLVGITNYIFKSLCLNVDGLPMLVAERTLRACQELHYWANVEIHKIRTRNLEYYRIPITLDGAMSSLSIDRTNKAVVLTFLTENYLENLVIWLDMYQRHDPRGAHLIIAAIGKSVSVKVLDICKQRGATLTKVFEWDPPCKVTTSGNGMDLAFLWYVKVHMVSYLVRHGLRVVYSDLDAYWIKNFFNLWDAVRESTKADLVLSPTFDMPATAILHWTFAPCAGFFCVEPTPNAQEFLGEWRRMTEVMFDDQIGLSELLFRSGIVWRTAEEADVSLIANAMMRSGRTATLAVLDPNTAKRIGVADPQSIGTATIWHPRWVMNPAQHIEAIRQLTSSGIE